MDTRLKNVGRILGVTAMMSSLSGCIVDQLDPFYYMYGAAVQASGGYDDVPAGTAQAPLAADQNANMQRLIDRETPDRYRSRSCEYIEMSLIEAAGYMTSTNALVKQLAEARKVAASPAWQEKGCKTANFPGGKIGIAMETVDAQKASLYSMPTSGVVVYNVGAGSPAQQGGILTNDLIVAVNEQPVADSVEFRLQLAKAPIGSTVNLKVWRYQAFQTLPVVVGPGGTPVSMLPVSTSAAQNTAPSSHLQGMNLGEVNSSYAKAAGLPSAQGAWVIDTVKGSAADKAGIKPLDVIVEIGGQEVASAQDVAEISSRMRVGYKATVSVWRNQAKRDVKMVLKTD